MSKQYVQIQAEIITCGIHLTLKPGDRLLVVNGGVVSIYTGTPYTPTGEITRDTVELPKPSKRKGPGQGKKTHKSSPKPYPNTPAVADAILLALNGREFTPARELRNLIDLPAKSEWAFMFRDAIGKLVREGKVQRAGDSAASARYRLHMGQPKAVANLGVVR